MVGVPAGVDVGVAVTSDGVADDDDAVAGATVVDGGGCVGVLVAAGDDSGTMLLSSKTRSPVVAILSVTVELSSELGRVS